MLFLQKLQQIHNFSAWECSSLPDWITISCQIKWDFWWKKWRLQRSDCCQISLHRSEYSQPSRHETSPRHLNQVSVERDISKTSKKKTSFLRRLKCISRKMSFLRHFSGVSNNLQKDVFYVTSLRRLQYIWKKMSFMWRLKDVSNSYQKRCIIGAIQKGCHQVRGERSAQK